MKVEAEETEFKQIETYLHSGLSQLSLVCERLTCRYVYEAAVAVAAVAAVARLAFSLKELSRPAQGKLLTLTWILGSVELFLELVQLERREGCARPALLALKRQTWVGVRV